MPRALVVQEDVAEFAAAVTRVLTEPDLRAQLKSAGREFVERQWSSREMARRLLAFLRGARADQARRFDDDAIRLRRMTALERTTKCFAAPLIDDVSEPLYLRLVRRRQRCILGVLLGHALALFIV